LKKNQKQSVRTRRWVRRNKIVLPFVWRGLLPLLGLIVLLVYAFGPFAKNTVEARVHQGVYDALNAADHSWVRIEVSGQHVILSGTQPTPDSGELALEVARAARCDTWAGPKLCAVRVRGVFEDAQETPTQPLPPPATDSAAREIARAARDCEQVFASLLADRRIEFDTGSASILAISSPLLDDLAKAAEDCPVVIRIEGHSDSVGPADMNQILSLARAEAVRNAFIERGIPPERLAAEGFGSERPIGDNTTEEGRAMNRRIEFKVDLP